MLNTNITSKYANSGIQFHNTENRHRGLNIFTRKNKRCGVSLPVPCIRSSLSRGHQTIAIVNHKGQRYCV